MKIYHMVRSQQLPIAQDVAWAFFSNPANLLELTPPWANMVDESPERAKTIFPGLIHILRVKLLGWLSCRWVSEITYVDAPHLFVDEQKMGPFKFWHHRHFIRPVDNGVEVQDSVYYALPVGIFGMAAHRFFVQKQLNALFDYRARMLQEFFGEQ
jgi:ligand-binding SRPBCC domain-containing protein